MRILKGLSWARGQELAFAEVRKVAVTIGPISARVDCRSVQQSKTSHRVAPLLFIGTSARIDDRTSRRRSDSMPTG